MRFHLVKRVTPCDLLTIQRWRDYGRFMVTGASARGTRVHPYVFFGLAALALAQGGCSLILDFDQPTDAGPPDAPVTDTSCMAYEPNNAPSEAMVIVAGDIEAAICGNGETDYYKVTLDGAQSLLARITFMNRNGLGDLDLKLLRADGTSIIDESRTSADVEEVMCPGGLACPTSALAAGDYLIQVLGFNGSVQAPYTLHLELNAAPVDASVF